MEIEYAVDIAKKVCNSGCGACQGGSFLCPLAKYGVKDEVDKSLKKQEGYILAEHEVFILCANCENAEVGYGYEGPCICRKDLTKCKGCPVKVVEDNMFADYSDDY